jgi:hypothetical protein
VSGHPSDATCKGLDSTAGGAVNCELVEYKAKFYSPQAMHHEDLTNEPGGHEKQQELWHQGRWICVVEQHP